MKYRTIVADPPWPFQWAAGGKGGRRRRETELGYATMTLDQIHDLDVRSLAHPEGCHLFLWITDELYFEGEARAVLDSWGFKRCGPSIIWAKSNFGLGLFPRPAHEVLVVARRGEPRLFALNNVPSVQHWTQMRYRKNGGRIHSAKPDASLDLIERASEGPYVELFARRQRLGWDTWGDEALCHVNLSPRHGTNRAHRIRGG